MPLVKTAQIDEFFVGVTTTHHFDVTTLFAATSAGGLRPSVDVRDNIVSCQWENTYEEIDASSYANKNRQFQRGLTSGTCTITSLPYEDDADASLFGFSNYVEGNEDNNILFYMKYGEGGVQKEAVGVLLLNNHRSTEDNNRRRVDEWRFRIVGDENIRERTAP